MQKIDLRNNLKLIVDKLKSKQLIDFFNVNSKQPDFGIQLLNLIVDSKAGFDQSILDEKQNRILEQFNAKKYFETGFYSTIVKFVSVNNYDKTSPFLQNSKQLTNFYTFHNTLITSYNLIDNILFQDSELNESLLKDDYKSAENEGYITFEILSEDYVDFYSYSKVIKNVNELIKTVFDVIEALQNTKFDEIPKLILSDSGSNVLFSIKLPKEISKSISKIIDDIWKMITDRTGYRLEKLDEKLGASIEILSKIENAKKEGLLTPEQTEIWKRSITNTTKEIIMNNALTKSKSQEIYVISNQKMLTDATKKYLTDGKK